MQQQVRLDIEFPDLIDSVVARPGCADIVDVNPPHPSESANICAIIPAYNEAETIATIIQQTKKYIETVFVIDDCSTDNTADIARQNGAFLIQHSTNGGPGAALQSGYDAAIAYGFDYVVQIDGDGQHNPDHIPAMLEAAQECDVVIGSRFLNESCRDYPLVRRVGITFFTRVVNSLTHAGITDVTTGYRLYSIGALKQLPKIQNRHWAVEQTMETARKGFKIKEISVEMPVRHNGKSQFSISTYGLYPLRMIPAILRGSFSR